MNKNKPYKKLAVAVLFSFTSAYAHELFVSAPAILEAGETLRASIGYGHFPEMDPINEALLQSLNPLEVVGAEGKIPMRAENNAVYSSESSLAFGSYLILASTQPYFLTKTVEGTVRQSKTGIEDPLNCTQYTLYGKSVLNVAGAADKTLVTTAQGQRVEIVPLNNPANHKVGDEFAVQVLVAGVPQKNLTVVAEHSSDGASEEGEQVTDEKGMVRFTPKAGGEWMMLANYKAKYENAEICDEEVIETTLNFTISK